MTRHGLAEDAPAPVPLNKAVAAITVPGAFRPTLFAGEPDVVQPIAMTTDNRGRLWVVECLSYPTWTTNREGRDRVTIFEDKDGDGAFDERKVFWDKGRNLSGIALGFGGVWLCSTPELIFLPDVDGDDRPDSAPEVLLDGWSLESKHNVFNNLNWGPDGWLYGCNGILATSDVGVPGTPKEQRIPINCGVWRFHPTRRVFEAVAHGTTNPWGIAFDEYGQMFVANCVIKHLFHIIPGAHYERMFGEDFNPYLFQLIPSIADHIHWAGGWWKTEGAAHPQNDLVGGGHAHSGAMIYLGDTWPRQYRGRFFTVNIHGHRVNQDILVREGSGYVAKHAEDFLRVNDTWFRGVSVVPSQDGGVYVSDWSDAGECHDYEDIHRENGRIYKIAYGYSRFPAYDLARQNNADLIRNLSDKDEWLATRSRMLLQERAASISNETRNQLWEALTRPERTNLRLRFLWTFHALGGLTPERALLLLKDDDEYVRSWTIQLALETKAERSFVAEMAKLAPKERSPIARLYLSSALQRLSPVDRVAVAAGLVRHGEDSGDQNLPLVIWYGIESLVAESEKDAIALLNRAEIPQIRRFIAQRLSLAGKLNGLSAYLRNASPAGQADVVHGIFAAFKGRRESDAPEQWSRAAARLKQHDSREVRDEAMRLSLIFGDKQTLSETKALVVDKSADPAARASALEGLSQIRVPGVHEMLKQSLADSALRGTALRNLAAFEDPEAAKLILSLYPELTPQQKSEALNTLASRASFATALLEGVKAGQVPARDITPFTARQIQAYKDSKIEPLLSELGSFRGVAADKHQQIAKYKALFTPEALDKANLGHGRALFQRTCAACHTLFDQGGTLAPELTGSQRANLDYLLENIVDPNAAVWDRYKATYFETSDDRLISGAVLGENESTVTIQTQTGIVTLPRKEIVSRRVSALSMMPEGLLDAFQEQELVDLIAYLRSPSQVPLPKE